MSDIAGAIEPHDLGIGILFGRIREAVVVADVDTGLIVLWNPAAEKIFGYSKDEARGLPLVNLVPHRLRTAHKAGLALYSATGHGALIDTGRLVEVPALRKGGEEFTIELTLSPLDDVPGVGRFALALIRDVSERKRSEEQRLQVTREQAIRDHAEAENARLREIFALSPAIIFLIRGPDHVVEYANPRFLQLASARACVGQPLQVAFPELEGQGYVELLDRVYATGEPFVANESPIQGNSDIDGSPEEHYFNYLFQPMRSAHGDVEGILIHAVDVTEQVRARRRTEELAAVTAAERDRLQQVLDVLPEAVELWDTAANMVLRNPAAQEMLGREAVEFWMPISAGADNKTGTVRHLDGTAFIPHDLPVLRSLQQGTIVRGEQLLIQDGAGQDRPLLVNSAPIRNELGAIIGAVVVFQDISELKHLERQKDEFLATVSHDLKNPLTAISGTAQLLLRRTRHSEGPDSVRVTEGLGTINETARRMSRQLTELVDRAHLQMGRPLNLEQQPTDVVPILRRLVSAYGQTTERHTIQLETDLQEVVCDVDESRLESALTNLVTNALKYSPDGGPITLTLSTNELATGAWMMLRIMDSGIGIPADDLPRVFERYYRAANVLGLFEGTGLGLAGARQIVEQHGGTLTLVSEQGKGTTVSIQLPLPDRHESDGA